MDAPPAEQEGLGNPVSSQSDAFLQAAGAFLDVLWIWTSPCWLPRISIWIQEERPSVLGHINEISSCLSAANGKRNGLKYSFLIGFILMCISLLGRLNLTIPGCKTQSKFYLYQNVPFLPRLRIFAIQLNSPFFLFSQFPPGQNPRSEKLDPYLKHHFSSHGWKHHRKRNYHIIPWTKKHWCGPSWFVKSWLYFMVAEPYI